WRRSQPSRRPRCGSSRCRPAMSIPRSRTCGCSLGGGLTPRYFGFGKDAPPEARGLTPVRTEIAMNEDKFNMSLRKFLKQVGVTSQREIERIVREKGVGQGKLKVKMVLTAAGTNLNHVVEEDLDLG